MTAQLLPNVVQQFLDSNGVPLAGGKLYSYAAGTTTPQATYTDETAGTPNTNPVILNSAGKASVWLGSLAYKFMLKDSLGNLIWTVDNVSIINPASIDKTKIASNIAGSGLAQNLVSLALDVQTDNTTIQITGNQLAIKSGGVIPDLIPTASKLEVLTRNSRDYSCPGVYQQIPQYEWSSPSLISNPLTLPPSTASSVKWSPNGEFLAVGNSNTTPFIDIYQMTGGVLTKLADPATLPGAGVSEVTWSPCGDFLVTGGGVSPYLNIYQRSGNVFTKLSDPATLPSHDSGIHHPAINSITFSPNSDFLAVGYTVLTVGSFFLLYERSGTTFTDITSTSTITGVSTLMRWSPNSYMFAAGSSINVWTRADNVFTSITTPSFSTSVGGVNDFAFSPDGNFLAVAGPSSPYIAIFQITNGTTFTQLSNPASLPTSGGVSIAWSANSEYLLIGSTSTPFMSIYQVSGTTFTKIANPSSLPANQVNSADWTPTKQYLAIGVAGSPYIQVYKTASTLPSNALLWTREAPNV